MTPVKLPAPSLARSLGAAAPASHQRGPVVINPSVLHGRAKNMTSNCCVNAI
jgi:hypothetical protein